MEDLSILSESQLVALCQVRGSKDERPFGEVFKRHNTFVARVLFRYFSQPQDVEDLTQEVFFKAYRSLYQFEGRSSLKTWLFSIASNTAKNELRNRSRQLAMVDQSLQDMEEQLPDGDGHQPYFDVHQKQSFQRAFSQLNPQEQEILLLKDVEELTYEAIAHRLNITVSAAKMRAQRARLAMKKYYQENDYEQ